MAAIKENNKYIGITIGLNSDNESMWINGIKQNAIFLMNALEKAGHRVTLIDCNDKVKADKSGKIADDKLIWDSKKFPIHKLNTELEKLDVLIMLGVTLRMPTVKKFKGTVGNPNKKVIKYMCGNNYVIDMERNIFNEKTEEALWKYDGWVDECWYVPQQGYQNHEYYRVLMSLGADKVKPVPFVWDPMFIDEVEKFYSQASAVPVYQAKPSSEKQLCVMEPNMNVVKYSTIPLLIIEDAYVKYNIDFKTTNLISGTALSKQKGWTSMMNNTSMIKNMIHCAGDGAVQIYYDNTARIATTATGISVTGNVIYSGGSLTVEAALGDGATVNWDVTANPVAKVTIAGNRTLALPLNPLGSGQYASLLVIQDGTGSRTLTWNAAYEFKDDTAPTLTTTANKGDLFTFRYNGAKWLEVGRNQNLSLS